MARRPSAPPSSSGRVDVREWFASLRLSAFTAIMLGIVLLAVLVLVPSVNTYLDQRQQIAALKDSVAVTIDEIAALEREKERWQDETYILTQARERLYYVRPGEISFLVDDDRVDPATAADPEPVSAEVSEAASQWMSMLGYSVIASGLAKNAVPEPDAPASGVAPQDSSSGK